MDPLEPRMLFEVAWAKEAWAAAVVVGTPAMLGSCWAG